MFQQIALRRRGVWSERLHLSSDGEQDQIPSDGVRAESCENHRLGRRGRYQLARTFLLRVDRVIMEREL